jgi:hypothetical protein
VKKLSTEFAIVHSPTFNVRFKYLVFDLNKHNSSIIIKSRIIFSILSTRALTRTLIFATKTIPNSNEIYEISRWKLSMELLKNRKLLLGNLVSHLSYLYLTFEEYSGIKMLTPIHIGNKYLAESLKHHQTYLIEKIYHRKHYIKFDFDDQIRKTVLDKFIDWNPIIFIKFLKSNELEVIASKYLQDNYPLFFIELNKYLVIEYVNHELAIFSIDDLYPKRRLNSFETI